MLDAIELPNTYGIEKGIVNVVLAGGVEHLVEALEEKEDDVTEGWETLLKANISPRDIVVGISASGTTPYVLAALKAWLVALSQSSSAWPLGNARLPMAMRRLPSLTMSCSFCAMALTEGAS